MRKYFCAVLSIIFANQLQAQVQVRDEPRHHNVFENEYLRILDVYLEPGDTTDYHLHNTPSVFVFLTSTATGSQLTGQGAVSNRSTANSVQFDSLNTTRVHRVWNIDTGWFHVMDIELTGQTPVTSPQPLTDPSLSPLFYEALANAYKVNLDGKTLRLPPSATGYLLISFEDVDLHLQLGKNNTKRRMKPGHYAWIHRGESAGLRANTGIAGFLLLQLK